MPRITAGVLQPDQQSRQLNQPTTTDYRINSTRHEGCKDQSRQRQARDIQHMKALAQPGLAMHSCENFPERILNRHLGLLPGLSIAQFDHAVRQAAAHHNDRRHSQDLESANLTPGLTARSSSSTDTPASSS